MDVTDGGEIRSVADTALWMASLRADESTRRDAIIRDEWAAALAGARGARIARSMPLASAVAWGVVVRTSAIDRLVAQILPSGIDMVINLGAGMDMRPFRLDLPASLRWIEVDFPAVVEAKDSLLSGVAGGCVVERVGMNLLDHDARRAFLGRVGAESRKALVIAEGVIPYWSNADVALVAADISAVASVRFWLLDFDNAGRRAPPHGWEARLKSAPFLFQADDWFEFFSRCGWMTESMITSAAESARIRRPYPLSFPRGVLMRLLPNDLRQRILGTSGAALMAKRTSPADTRGPRPTA